jgi:F0F1-type ATP synthase assembly protein I
MHSLEEAQHLRPQYAAVNLANVKVMIMAIAAMIIGMQIGMLTVKIITVAISYSDYGTAATYFGPILIGMTPLLGLLAAAFLVVRSPRLVAAFGGCLLLTVYAIGQFYLPLVA